MSHTVKSFHLFVSFVILCYEITCYRNSIETALEEDAPGLLQVLIKHGVTVDELRLYGENDSFSDDSSLLEETFSELEDVISQVKQSFTYLYKDSFYPQCVKRFEIVLKLSALLQTSNWS